MNNYKILKNLDNVKKGKIGEEIARRYLVLMGMKIICSNYKTKFGEIDIIAKVENKIVFIGWCNRLVQRRGCHYLRAGRGGPDHQHSRL